MRYDTNATAVIAAVSWIWAIWFNSYQA